MNPNLKKRIESINKGIIPEGYKKTKVGIVPVEWEIEKLSEIGKNYIGLTYTPEDTANTGLIVLRSSNIKDSKIDLNDCVFVKCEVSEKNRVKTNDILICARNGSSSLIGKSALITEAYSNLAFGAFMSVYRTKYYNYIFQAFQSFIIKKQILRNLGARINQITTADINQFKVPFPPLPEQQKIAEILSTQDKLIELQARKIEQLQALKKACLQRMFPKKGCDRPEIRFPEFTDAWEQRKFSELTEIRSASRVHKEEWQTSGVPFYRSSDVMAALNGTENEKAFISEELYEKLSAVSGKLEKGDVLVTGGGSVGKPYIVPNNEPLYTKDADLLWIKNNENLDPYFVYTFFFSPTFTDYLNSVSHVGTIAHYTITQLGETPITLPCVSEQQKIGDYFRNLDFLITLHQHKPNKKGHDVLSVMPFKGNQRKPHYLCT